MSNTTVFVLCVTVPLLLGGFINFYAHKPWILYLPLVGLLLLVGYIGHLAIQSYAYPQNKPEQLSDDSPQVKNERSNINITSHDQKGGFTGINQGGTVNLEPQPRSITPDKRAIFIRELATAPKGKVNVSWIGGQWETFEFAEQIREALQSAGYFTGPDMSSSIRAGGTPAVGVVLKVRSEAGQPPFTGPIQRAFKAIGIEAPGQIGRPKDVAENELTVEVGARP